MKKEPPKLFNGKPVVKMNAVVKPTFSLCDFHCDYCCRLCQKKPHESERQEIKMSDEVLENFIRQYITQQNCKKIVFKWRKGEPTRMGLDFFKKVVELEKRHLPINVFCENELQTNGLLLDEEWCKFLKENNFIVFLNIEGPEEFHNKYRKSEEGEGTFQNVMKAVELFKKYKIFFNTETCINKDTAKYPLEIYRFLRDKVEPVTINFSPTIEFKDCSKDVFIFRKQNYVIYECDPRLNPEHRKSVLTSWSVSPEDYSNFLIKIFKEWYIKDMQRVSVALFENAITQWLGKIPPLCVFSPFCKKGVAIEPSGDVYCCGRCIHDEYKLGNVIQDKLIDLANSDSFKEFKQSKYTTLPKKCLNCKWLKACFGGCVTNRFVHTNDDEAGLNYLCRGFINYFEYINPYISEIVKRMGKEVKIP